MKYQLQELGLKTYITEENGLYRVYTGPFADKRQAQAVLGRVQKKISPDAYVTALEVMDEQVSVAAVTKEALPQTPMTPPPALESTQQPQAQDKVQTKADHAPRLQKQPNAKFYLGASMGATKYDISKSGSLPLGVTLRTYGPSYGIEGGYYFYDNLFTALHYQRSELRYEDFDALFASVNYQFDSIGTLSPYVGLLAGVSKLSWSKNPVTNADTSLSEDSTLLGLQLGGDIHIYEGVYAFAYYRYMQLDFTTTATLGTAKSEIDHSSQQDFNVGLKYKF